MDRPSGPAMIERALAEKLLPLHFPGLGQVADWAPVATLSKQEAAESASASAPPPVSGHGPATDQNMWLRTTLKNRNVRNNAAELFTDGLPLSPDGKHALRLAVRTGVIRPAQATRDSGHYSGLIFSERAEEPMFSQDQADGSSYALTTGAGDLHGSGLPGRATKSSQGSSSEGYNGDYTEYNRKFSQQAHFYAGDLHYEIMSPNGYSLRVDTGGQFEGLLLDDWARELARKFPRYVVHPGAVTLPADAAQRDEVINSIAAGVSTAPTDREPLRLVGDLMGDVAREDFLEAAETLLGMLQARGLGGPVDLALIRPSKSGRASDLRHYIYRASGSGMAADALADTDQPGDAWAAPFDSHGAHHFGEPREGAYSDTYLEEGEDSVGLLSDAGSPGLSPNLQINDIPMEVMDVASPDTDAGADWEAVANAALTKAREDAGKFGKHAVAAAEKRSPLGNARSDAEAISVAWHATRSGFALPENEDDLAVAQQLPQFRAARTVALFQPEEDGAYLIRERSLTRADLVYEIGSRLIAAERQLPLWLIIHGSDSYLLAPGLANTLAHRGHKVTVIGTRGRVGGIIDRLAALVSAHPASVRWVAYHDGEDSPFESDSDLSALMTKLSTARSGLALSGDRRQLQDQPGATEAAEAASISQSEDEVPAIEVVADERQAPDDSVPDDGVPDDGVPGETLPGSSGEHLGVPARRLPRRRSGAAGQAAGLPREDAGALAEPDAPGLASAVELARRHLAGEPGLERTPAALRNLVGTLLAAEAGVNENWQALELLRSLADGELSALLSDGELLPLLEVAFPPDSWTRPDLELFRTELEGRGLAPREDLRTDEQLPPRAG
jgi:hypothetical protein